MNKVITLSIFLTLAACGKNANYASPIVQTCTLDGKSLTCPDGTSTDLPTEVTVEPVEVTVELIDPQFILQDPEVVINEVVVENVVVDEVIVEVEDIEDDIVVCEKDNRNKRKCKKVTKN